VAYQIQWRRDSAADWTAADPILAEGEAGYETDTGKLKVGDGVTAWTALSYYTGNITIGSPNDGEVHMTPKAASATGTEGTMFYATGDDHVYVATE